MDDRKGKMDCLCPVSRKERKLEKRRDYMVVVMFIGRWVLGLTQEGGSTSPTTVTRAAASFEC